MAKEYGQQRRPCREQTRPTRKSAYEPCREDCDDEWGDDEGDHGEGCYRGHPRSASDFFAKLRLVLRMPRIGGLRTTTQRDSTPFGAL
jgi:hypothetical protein